MKGSYCSRLFASVVIFRQRLNSPRHRCPRKKPPNAEMACHLPCPGADRPPGRKPCHLPRCLAGKREARFCPKGVETGRRPWIIEPPLGAYAMKPAALSQIKRLGCPRLFEDSPRFGRGSLLEDTTRIVLFPGFCRRRNRTMSDFTRRDVLGMAATLLTTHHSPLTPFRIGLRTAPRN